jgi:type II secretory pathway pseudopilin PulG
MNSKKTVFTIVKILIVVVMLGILGACVVPEFRCCGNRSGAVLSNMTTNLQSIRAQLELYKKHHKGAYPTDITAQLTKKTDSDGTINASGAYGPYLYQFPANPYVRDPVQAVKTTGAPGEGWDYDPATGVFRFNADAIEGHGGQYLSLADL